jgi:hypothetical protein
MRTPPNRLPEGRAQLLNPEQLEALKAQQAEQALIRRQNIRVNAVIGACNARSDGQYTDDEILSLAVKLADFIENG